MLLKVMIFIQVCQIKGISILMNKAILQEKWVFDDGHWYYIPERGVVSKGWVEVKDKW